MHDRLKDLLGRVNFPGLTFEHHFEGTVSGVLRDVRWYLRVHAPEGSSWALDSHSGASLPWNGRKWRLSPHMTDGEIVQTAFLALRTALEHEAREKFTFDGVTVFDPHYDIHKLVELRRSEGALKERS